MARISAPIQFSAHFGIDPREMRTRGIFDPSVNVDTTLFIDPLLLPYSGVAAFRETAWPRYEKHFESVIEVLLRSNNRGDAFWQAAIRLLTFREIKWTCLGYGSDGIAGSGSGRYLTGNMIDSAQQIARNGVSDPELFLAFALFEDGIGPDRISDMATNVILADIVQYTAEKAIELGVPTERFDLTSVATGRLSAFLPRNPTANGPVLLLPQDILRALPVATDWAAAGAATDDMVDVRNDVNMHIIGIWQRKSKEAKADLKDAVLKDPKVIKDLIEMLRSIDPISYDFSVDPEFEIRWRELGEEISRAFSYEIEPPSEKSAAELSRVVSDVVSLFRFLVEDRRISEEFYLPSGKPRTEKAAQRLFFAVAYSYCRANKIDITPEADTGNGPVDFKFSQGFDKRVLVEIKLSRNPKIVAGYEKQLAAYARGEETNEARYLIIDVGNMGEKLDKLFAVKNAAALRNEPTFEIDIVDATRLPSASLL